MKITQDYIPVGHPNRPGVLLDKIGMLARIFHGTANRSLGADAEMHRKYCARVYKKIGGKSYEADGVTPFRFGCAHVYIDKDSAVEMIPPTEYAPAAGDHPLPANNGSKGQTIIARDLFVYRQNYRSFQIELCMNDMSAWDKVLKNAIYYVATRCPNPALLNFTHYDLTGKLCPEPFIVKGAPFEAWAKFKLQLETTLTALSKIDYAADKHGINREFWRDKVINDVAVSGYTVGCLFNALVKEDTK